ncbi:flagellar hook-length control protein FliK [Halomonas sp. LC1]|uniref:flagellar hook-length control protein FliK n=1 Tax=Halomonas sp. LC1 TaxID=3043733 RepID=UPI0025526725|nr:flagellar hook-length control protein FliK [Halomonas sp. LC1]MDK9688541.1 flagellar hook-length control protein FliK [Halomonas sp. LC1]
MSGITPLIDTLLHQVLGRQAEVSTQRALNAPVQPVYAGDGPRALQGDAGLDGRPLAPLLGDLKRLPGSPDGLRQAPPGTLPGNAPSSTQTHFSPAARTIADVLLRFPAPPTVLRPQAPLMSTQEPPSAPVVANRLEASIRDSGLFYEAHLKRWFQGDTSRQQLMREPQMQPGPRPAAVFVPSFTSAVLSATATAPASALVTSTAPFTILPNTPLTPLTGNQPLLERPAMLPPSPNAVPSPLTNSRELPQLPVALPASSEWDVSSRGPREIVHESLQGLVRQQLEMMVTPTLRWEGDVWAGIFMALVINLPGRDGQKEGSGDEGEADEGWRSEMQLDVPNLGRFNIALALYQGALTIDLTAEDAETRQRLEEGVGALEQRLSAFDFRKVKVMVRHVTLESDDGDLG